MRGPMAAMNFSKAVLPSYLSDTLSCFAVVRSKALDGAPDVAVCDTNGFLHELKKKKILRSLKLVGKGISIRCSYLLQNEKPTLYYVVLTQTHKLLIVRSTKVCLQVADTHENVEKFEVYDFECLGFPQIKITFLSAEDELVWRFPEKEHHKATADAHEEAADGPGTGSLADSLEEKLHILKKHVDELSEEYNLLRKQFLSEEVAAEFGMVAVGRAKLCLPLGRKAQPAVRVCDKWVKAFGSSLILGMKIQNCGCETISDLELVIQHEDVRDYRYRLFQASAHPQPDLFSPPSDHRSVEAGGEVWAVGAFHVPALSRESAVSVSCCLTSAGMSSCLARERFEVTALQMASGGGVCLEEGLTVEDVMAVRTSEVERRVEVRGEGMGRGAVGGLLREGLGFRRTKAVRDEILYCTSAYLGGVVVGVRAVGEEPSVWRLVVLAREEGQVRVLVKALREGVGEGAEVSEAEV